MGAVLSYDDKFATPSSEIKLDSGEHIVMALDKKGLVVKTFTSGKENILFKTDANAAAAICASLFDDRGESKTTPLRILTSVVVNMPNAQAVQKAFEDAEDAV